MEEFEISAPTSILEAVDLFLQCSGLIIVIIMNWKLLLQLDYHLTMIIIIMRMIWIQGFNAASTIWIIIKENPTKSIQVIIKENPTKSI